MTLVMTYEDEVKFLAMSLSVPPSATGVKWSFGSERGAALSAQCWKQGKCNCRVKWKHGEGDPLREHCVFNIRRGENFLIRPLGNIGRHFLSTFI